MTSADDIRTRVARVFGETFDADAVEFSDSLSRETLQAWDSLGHIRLIAALEDEFGVQFTIEEIEKLTSARRILDQLAATI